MKKGTVPSVRGLSLWLQEGLGVVRIRYFCSATRSGVATGSEALLAHSIQEPS